MSNPVSVDIEVHLPPALFSSRIEGEKTIDSPSEQIAKNVIALLENTDPEAIRLGLTSNKEPDYMLGDSGFEVTWSEPNSLIRQFQGAVPLSKTSLRMEMFDDYLSARLQAKATARHDGKYCGAEQVSLCCISITPYIRWYFTEPSYFSICSLGDWRDEVIVRARNKVWRKIYDTYIETGIFENIYVIQPTHDSHYVCYDMKAANTGGVDIIKLDIANKTIPWCTFQKPLNVRITHQTQFIFHILNYGRPKNPALYQIESL